MHRTNRWFDLARHEDPALDPPVPTPPPAPVPSPPPPVASAEPSPADTAEAEKWKALARKHEQRAEDNLKAAKANEAAAKELADIKAAQQTEAERLAAKAEAAEQAAASLRDRVLKAEIKAAAGDFADPADAPLYLDLAKYGGDDIDPDVIKADLAAVLAAKPHLAKPTTTPPPPPPDLLQGARGGDPAPVDYRTAPRDVVAVEAAKYGIKVR